MCGIVGAVAQRDVAQILLEGLRRLEYRGYDSAGMAVINGAGGLKRLRRLGKVQELASAIDAEPLTGGVGIAHTRWATHGAPSERNAHPHISGDHLAVVHNGIIENYEELRTELQGQGYVFASETDSEVIAHLIERAQKTGLDLFAAVKQIVGLLRGAYATVIVDSRRPNEAIVAREGSPLVIGLGIGENFIASDQLALLPVTRKFIFLEEGDVARITRTSIEIEDRAGVTVERPLYESDLNHDAGDKGEFRHYMIKEIFEQPTSISNTLEGRLTADHVIEEAFGANAKAIFDQVKRVQIVACGTSYHAGLIARYWFEDIAGIPCNVEIASEFRYRKLAVQPDTLLISISQSGETADTLAALRLGKQLGFKSLTICNASGSSLVRESDLAFLTRAGAEIGVASTKAFTTQLTALLMLVTVLARRFGLTAEREAELVKALASLPGKVKQVLTMNAEIAKLSEAFAEKHHSLFLGRGTQYPVAMEGALKLKEISYIHAEAYAAGELKHGPLALVDSDMPVIAVAPNNDLLEKLKSNLQEVKARGGQLFVFADESAELTADKDTRVINLLHVDEVISPIVYSVPLQLLSYHVAVLKGTDVDQPRNLAKSVTVE